MSIIQIPSEKTMSIGKWKCMLPLFSYLAGICDCVQETLYIKVQLTHLCRRASQMDVDSRLGVSSYSVPLSVLDMWLVTDLPRSGCIAREKKCEGWDEAAVQSTTRRLGLLRVAGALLRMSPPAAQSPGNGIRVFLNLEEPILFSNTRDVYRIPPVQEGAGHCSA